jgi:hypothetical protein
VNSRNVVVGIVLVAALAVITGSVLLLGYVIGGASLLLMSAVLIRKVVRRWPTSRLRPLSGSRWLDENEREAA